MLTEGQILEGKYKVGPLLSKGGMGAVFVGEAMRIKRKVAIKVLHEEEHGSENSLRFEKEAQAAGQIGSDHIVEVLDLGTTPEGDRFMVMEFLDGESMKARLKRGRLQPTEVIALISQVLEGLTAAHAAGIVHRDLKPDNIYILKGKAGRRDFVKIVDFGISKFANALGGEGGGMTKTGAVMGTPFYMSPEQARATSEVDNRSDLYAVGVLMYEAATGAVPFNGNTFTELLFKIVFEEAPHPNSLVPDLDPGFVSIVLKAMSRDPAERYQSAAELQEALSRWQPGGAAALPPPAPAPKAPPGKDPLAGTALLDVSQHPLAQSHPFPTHSPGQSRPQPAPLAQTAYLAESGPQPGQFAPQPYPAAQQAWQAQQPFAQSVSSGSQVLDASRAPPKGRAGVFAVAAVLMLGIGGTAAFLLTRSPKETADVPATVETAVSPAAPPPAPATPTATATATAVATAQPPTAIPSTEPAPTAAPTQRRPGGLPPPPKPADTGAAKPPPKPTAPLKDLGY